MELTKKKQKFIEGIRQGMNRKEAAIYAGCPEKSAKQQGYRLMQDKQVRFYLERNIQPKNINIPEIINNSTDPLELLSQLMNDELVDMHTRLEVAIFLLPYFHSKHAWIDYLLNLMYSHARAHKGANCGFRA